MICFKFQKIQKKTKFVKKTQKFSILIKIQKILFEKTKKFSKFAPKKISDFEEKKINQNIFGLSKKISLHLELSYAE